MIRNVRVGVGFGGVAVPTISPGLRGLGRYMSPGLDDEVYLLGLLAKIKCSICSYQLNIWYGDIVPSILNSFLSWSVPTVLACQTGR